MRQDEIDRAADEIARRFDATMMRTEDRLNDEYLQRVIREKATQVLTERQAERDRIIAQQFETLARRR